MKTNVPPVRYYVLIVLLVCSSVKLFSQSITTGNGKFEIGLGLGPSFFLGDLGGSQGIGKPFIRDVNLPLTKLSKGLYASYYPSEWMGFRVAINLSKLEGHDSLINDKGGAETYRKQRNLSFESGVSEFYVATEIYPTVFFERYDGLQGKLRPYGIIGIGAFHFNPKTNYIDPSGNSKMVALQPLMLEGQGMTEYPDRKTYKLTQLEIPMGFGFKYYIKEAMYFGFEILHRKTFTDYMDDVSKNYIDPIYFDSYLPQAEAQMARQLNNRSNLSSPATRPQLDEQRGDPKENDSYFSTVIRFGWRLNSNKELRRLQCPRFY